MIRSIWFQKGACLQGDPDVEQLREAYQKAGTRGFWKKTLELAFDSSGCFMFPLNLWVGSTASWV